MLSLLDYTCLDLNSAYSDLFNSTYVRPVPIETQNMGACNLGTLCDYFENNAMHTTTISSLTMADLGMRSLGAGSANMDSFLNYLETGGSA